MSSAGRFQPLRLRHFQALFTAHLVSNLGDWLAFLALSGLVGLEWRASALRVALLAVCYVLPLVCVAPLAGVFVDRWDLRRVLVASDILRALLLVGMAYTSHFGLLCALLFLLQAIGSFFNPAQAAAIPRLVPREGLLAANALTQSAGQASKLLGPALAGFLVAAFGPRGCFLADAASFALSAAALATLPVMPPAPRALAEARARPLRQMWTEMRAGWSFVLQTPEIARAALLITVMMVALGGFIAVIGVHARDALRMEARGMGLLLSTLGAGAVAGAFLVTHLGAHRNRLQTIAIGMLLGGAALALLAASRDARLAFAGAFAVGMAAAATLVPGHTLVQELTPRGLLGRVMSSIVAVVGLAQGASMAVSGATAQLLGTRWVLGAGAVLACGLAALHLGLASWKRRPGREHRPTRGSE